jgi:hypothetical protein
MSFWTSLSVTKRVSIFAALILASASASGQHQQSIPPQIRAALARITPANLKGDLSFLASDTLQGRYTPSPGLDAAAEFIASQFRAAGLQPGGDQDYFQIANMVDRHMPEMRSDIIITHGDKTIDIPAQSITVTNTAAGVKFESAPALLFKAKDEALVKGSDVAGKVVIVPGIPASKRRDVSVYEKAAGFEEAIKKAGAALEITVSPVKGNPAPRLIEPDEARFPTVTVTSDELQNLIEHSAENAGPVSVAADIPAPKDEPATVKNVIGVLRGSDPALKDTYVMLTAHYDHIGTLDTAGRSGANRKNAGNDRIFNGANDDGSGTVSVIEIAKALASMPQHPKRSLIFMTFFGEERGDLGSKFYGHHPRFPLAETVADLNLEQVGRTDATDGQQVNTASLTGYDYSDVTKFLSAAGRELGIKVYMNSTASDPYFLRSDNAALASLGVPAETLCVAFDYPDYHGLADEWQKIDYDNMARVDRAVALGLLNMANATVAPAWNAENSKTLPFRQAQQKLHAGTNP